MTWEIGKNWPHPAEVQALLFDRDYFTKSKAKSWAKKHGYRYGNVRKTTRYYRLRQYSPKDQGPWATITFEEGLKAVIEPNGKYKR